MATAHCEPGPAAAPVAGPARLGTPRIALVGNPNTGKTTVFNRLCGTRAKTSNFPGTTTSARVGRALVGHDTIADIVDLPGFYRLNLDLPEARIARDVLGGVGAYSRPDAVLLVLDACNLTRNLVLAGELKSYGVPMVVALNMVDLAQRRGLTLDPRRLTDRIGCPVIPVVARRGVGLEEVRVELGRALTTAAASAPAQASESAPAFPSPSELEAWAEQVVTERGNDN